VSGDVRQSSGESGLGGWWPRPHQAAAGGLDHVPVGQWPALAAGYDSPALRRLVKLRAGEPGAARLDALDLMPRVLHQLGFEPSPGNAEFTARCQAAVDIVQHGLDATGYGRYRMQARLDPGRPGHAFAALPEGSGWNAGDGMTRDLDDTWLLVAAAESVSAAIEEIHQVEWPVCAVHGDDRRTGWEPAAFVRKVAWWQCTRARHLLAPVGQLTAQIARTP
jgi:hypothetical protein